MKKCIDKKEVQYIINKNIEWAVFLLSVLILITFIEYIFIKESWIAGCENSSIRNYFTCEEAFEK